jgi:PAS domain-containing protein
MLWELRVSELRYRAVMEVLDGATVTSVARSFGVSQGTVHVWLGRYAGAMAVDYPLSIRHRDGAVAEVRYNASVYRDADGNVLAVFAAARDVTNQVQE